MVMNVAKPLISLAAVTAVALLGSAGVVTAAATAPQVRVHAIFGGTGAHVGQVLDVRTKGRTSAKVSQICWEPAPIGRPACSASVDGAPSATGTTKLTLKLADGTELHKSIAVSPAYIHRGGHGGSDAAPGHVSCAGLTLYGNVPANAKGNARDKVTTLAAGAQVAQYNRIGDYVFYWEYATNKAGFGKIGCVSDGLGS
jgi:hypothetical protein